jgi:hypothetical protein
MTPDTLTQLIAKIQAQLLDNATLFTTATVTAAVRQALADINLAAPQLMGITMAGVAGQKEYELEDELATGIFDVLLQGSGDTDYSLTYYAFVEDGRHWFRLRNPQPSTATLIVRYTLPHTINGLDGATESTFSDELNVAALNGSVYYCCLVRSAATIESNNVAPGVPVNWIKLADVWHERFLDSLHRARTDPPARGEPARSTWEDAQHSTIYP